MRTKVYANNNEICCKASSGMSTLPPMDVCLSPPPPGAGPIPIPYPNITRAKDLDNGSSTVFIRRTEIALKNVSCFSTSTGNEPATMPLPKGIVTHVLKGKAFFTNWSPNVKVEGLSVCRHLDIMTHNHR
ncbi:PAAR-like domain-containing protein [Parachitinimonas caeni]|uniref:DUF4150 domain-containing protein n=1 Tax=Parachitinimonas caeni TaxID=3031301 RepID=A0ABT7E2H4_9NEIS|nr:PAAR-like domain-containing protein [Parachitinimonas caeni]MDK2126512.1 DUF4150 domain-containing protein [Parachitinimonas caeni]